MIAFLLGFSAHLEASQFYPTQVFSPDLRWVAEAEVSGRRLLVEVSPALSQGRAWKVSVPVESPRFDISLERGGTLSVHLVDSAFVYAEGRLVGKRGREQVRRPESPFPFPEPLVRFVVETGEGYLAAGPRLLVMFSKDGRELWRFRAPGSTSALFWDGRRAWLAWSQKAQGKAFVAAFDREGQELLRLEFAAEGEPPFVARVWSDGRELRVLCSRTLYVYRLEE